MKLATLALAAYLVGIPAVYADDDDDASIKALKQMAECQAVSLTLMQMYNSMAASIDVLSPDAPRQLQLLRESYRSLAESEADKVQEMIGLTKLALLPNIEPAVGEHYLEAVGKNVVAIQKALNLGAYDKQQQVQRELLSTDRQCEAFVQHLTNIATY